MSSISSSGRQGNQFVTGLLNRPPQRMVEVTDHGVREITTLPTDSGVRKAIPIARGVLDYFPAALVELAKLAEEGNRKHNPGEELHWARGKSMDHADCIMRHLIERGTVDTDGFLHDVKVAWRALAQLQEALEARGAPLARGARVPNVVVDPKVQWVVNCDRCNAEVRTSEEHADTIERIRAGADEGYEFLCPACTKKASR